MLYRVSLTGKHDRFSVPQLGYLGYHHWLCTDLIALRWQLPPRLSRVQVDAIAFRETTEVVGDKEGPHACFSPTRKERVFAKPSPMLLVFLGCPITEELPVTRPSDSASAALLASCIVQFRDRVPLNQWEA